MFMKHIAIHSVPRSGSSWFGEILNSSPSVSYAFQPLFSYQFKGALNANSSMVEIQNFYNNIKETDDKFVTQQDDRRSGIKPSFQKSTISHIAYKEVRYHYILENLLEQNPAQRVIGLIRNPLSVLSSWKNAPREFRTDLGWKFDSEWKHANLKNMNKAEEYFGFERWKETALLFKKLENKFPSKFKLVFYTDLLSNTEPVIRETFEFIELDFTMQTKEFIYQSIQREVTDTYSVFKKKQTIDNDYLNNMPKSIIDAVNTECKEAGLADFLNFT